MTRASTPITTSRSATSGWRSSTCRRPATSRCAPPTAAYWMIFNGEIYNYLELGAELREQGVALRSSGDSEVLLETYARSARTWCTGCVACTRSPSGTPGPASCSAPATRSASSPSTTASTPSPVPPAAGAGMRPSPPARDCPATVQAVAARVVARPRAAAPADRRGVTTRGRPGHPGPMSPENWFAPAGLPSASGKHAARPAARPPRPVRPAWRACPARISGGRLWTRSAGASRRTARRRPGPAPARRRYPGACSGSPPSARLSPTPGSCARWTPMSSAGTCPSSTFRRRAR